MFDRPITFYFDMLTGHCAQMETLNRKLSYMKNMFSDAGAVEKVLSSGQDPLLYEFFDMGVPDSANDLAFGCSICYPGKVGEEFHMTKGHYHEVFDTAETYLCLRGHGLLMMETPDGDWSVQEMTPGSMVYVPGGWAHRSINVGNEPFITFYNFRGDAGHDYATIESLGFRKLVVADGEGWKVIDNSKWVGRA
jgi:glucose-6-phosphate isomerase